MNNNSTSRTGAIAGGLIATYTPQLRFMQAIVNFQRHKGNDCFYMEDDQFLEEFERFLKELSNG